MENSVNFAFTIAANAAKLGVAGSEVIDNFDFDRIVRARHRLAGASDLYLKSKDDVEKVREERMQAAKAAQEQEAQQRQAETELERMKALAQGGRAMKDVAGTPSLGNLGGKIPASMGGFV